jgi:hypothetical protein
MIEKIFLPQTHADIRGHFSPATCGTERVITLPREKPSHTVFPEG